MNITLKQLQAFLAVAQHENLTRASEALFLTKGAVSQALTDLEKQLGVRLFDRTHSRMALNHEGMVFRPVADEIIQRCQDAENIFQHEEEHFLHIGVSKTIGTYFLPKLFKEFEERFHWLPKAHIANTNDLLELTSSFTLDMVLLEGENFYDDIVTEQWIEDEMAVFAQKGHLLADGHIHAPEALNGQRWILREPNSGTREMFEHTLGALLSPHEIAQSLDSPEAVLGMVEQGIGVTFASKAIAEMTPFRHTIATVRLTERFTRTFFICYHTKKYHSPSMNQFLTFCRTWHP